MPTDINDKLISWASDIDPETMRTWESVQPSARSSPPVAR